jgi:hypothetical protein
MQEYIVEHLKPEQVFFRMRLGGVTDDQRAALPAGVSERVYVVTQRYADAICLYSNRVEIWEAKLVNPLAAIVQLQLYERLFRKTPEFARYKDAKISLHLLTPIWDEDLNEICGQVGIEISMWEPDWVTEYLTSYYRISK